MREEFCILVSWNNKMLIPINTGGNDSSLEYHTDNVFLPLLGDNVGSNLSTLK